VWAPSAVTFDPVRLVWDAKAVIGVNITASWAVEGGQRTLLAESLDAWDRAACRALVAGRFDAAGLAEAFGLVAKRSTVGRVVIALGPGARS
jgi:hypothetical protein